MQQHADYENGIGFSPNDVAMLKLASPANTDSTAIEIIRMSNTEEQWEGMNGWISGWGVVDVGGNNDYYKKGGAGYRLRVPNFIFP